jgi:hypothetical protein
MVKHVCKYCLEEFNSDESYVLHLLDHNISQTNQLLSDIMDVLNQINSSLAQIAAALDQIAYVNRIRKV